MTTFTSLMLFIFFFFGGGGVASFQKNVSMLVSCPVTCKCLCFWIPEINCIIAKGKVFVLPIDCSFHDKNFKEKHVGGHPPFSRIKLNDNREPFLERHCCYINLPNLFFSYSFRCSESFAMPFSLSLLPKYL